MQFCVVAGGGSGDMLRNDELLENKFVCDAAGDIWCFIFALVLFSARNHHKIIVFLEKQFISQKGFQRENKQINGFVITVLTVVEFAVATT